MLKIEKNITKEREINYDLLRILATCMVVFLHVSSCQWHATPSNSMNWSIMNIYDSLVRSAVPLFFMLSGAFMLKKETNIKKLYKKILSLILVYGVWSVLYAIDYIGLSQLKTINLIEFIKIVLQSKYHLWFIPTLIGLYILNPILYAIVHFEDGKYIKYILTIFFVFGVIFPTLTQFVKNYEIIIMLLEKIPIELMGYANYMILGYYLANKKKVKMNSYFLLGSFLGIVIISSIIGKIDAIRIGSQSNILYGYFMLPVFVEAIIIFILLQNFKFKEKSEKINLIIQKMSALTMGVYLFHPFIIDHLKINFNITPLSFSPIFSIPILSLVIVLLCFIISFIFSKIPIVKNLWKI